MNRSLFLFFFCLSALSLLAETVAMQSPHNVLQASFAVDAQGRPFYTLCAGSDTLIRPSHLGLALKGEHRPGSFSGNVESTDAPSAGLIDHFLIDHVESTSFAEDWSPVWGEESRIHNEYREYVISLKQTAPAVRWMALRFRLFDEGVAFRYEFPQMGLGYFTLDEELTEFAMPGDVTAYWIPGDYDTQEYEYTRSRLSEIRQLNENKRIGNLSQTSFSPTGVQTALLLKVHSAECKVQSAECKVHSAECKVQSAECKVHSAECKVHSDYWLTIHEAALVDYACMHLDLDDTNFIFRTHLTPDAQGNKGNLQTPCHSPWRTIQVAPTATQMLANRMTLNLNEPCKIADTSWIRPMKYVGVWWEMINGMREWSYTSGLPSVRLGEVDYAQLQPHGRHGATTENVCRYIDFAAKNGFDGVLVEGWNIGWEDWFGHQKDYVYDFVTPYPDFDVERIHQYAKARGVKMIMHHETSSSVRNYERHLDTAYRFMEQYEYPAVKSGYVGPIVHGETHYSQWMNNHYLYCITEAAKHHIMVNAHEAVRPTGLCRTWPNLIGNESAMGTEYQAMKGIEPGHTCILPFTRLNGGPMDYTPGIFEMDMSKMNPNNHNHCLTTLCNQLSLYVTMYSPLQMAADLPENYERFPDAFRFIRDVAIDWDQSWYLEAEPMDYLTIARKTKGKDEYFVGGTCGLNARTSDITLSFLPAGRKYVATIWQDAKDADFRTNPQAYVISEKVVTSKTRLKLYEAPSGGYAITLRPL